MFGKHHWMTMRLYKSRFKSAFSQNFGGPLSRAANIGCESGIRAHAWYPQELHQPLNPRGLVGVGPGKHAVNLGMG
jgi:hypothetical protein